MNHEFSWRKVLEITAIVAILYIAPSVFLDTDTSIIGIIKNVGSVAIFYAAASKGLEKISERE